MNDRKNRWQDNFRKNPEDSYCIYQLRRDPKLAKIRFMNFAYLRKHGLEPAFENYEAVYSGKLDCTDSTNAMLEDLYVRFNLDQPQDFTRRSISVSDVIALKQNGAVSYHYVDSIGFSQVPYFDPEFCEEGFAHAEV